MHTTDLGNGWHAIHDGDLGENAYEDQVKIYHETNGTQAVIPFDVIVALVAHVARKNMVSEIEQTKDRAVVFRGIQRLVGEHRR